MQGYSIPETTRAYGAVLLNADGEEFTDSLGPRDAVSQAIVDEVEKGNGVETPDGRPAVLLDTTRIPEADADVSLPYMLRRYRAAGIDPLAEPILTYPVLHYQNGGLVIDTDARDDARRPLRLRRDRGRHARPEPDDGQLAARVLRLRAPRRQGRGRKEQHEDDDRDRSVRRRRGRRRAPLRLGAEGHPAGPARRARRRRRARDERAGPARALDDPEERPGRRLREEPRLPGHRDRRLHVPRRRALPAPPGADLPGAEGRHRARDDRASAALERRPHDHAREHRPEHRLPAADRALGVHPGLGRPRRQVRAEGLRLREHELPEDVRPRRRREGDQAVRARVDRRRRRQAVPAGDRRRRHRRLRRLRDVPREGGDRAADRHAQRRPDRRAARGRALRPAERDRDRPDGARRRRHRPQLPHRARRHAHDPQPGRGQLPVLGRAPRDRARRRGRLRRVRPGGVRWRRTRSRSRSPTRPRSSKLRAGRRGDRPGPHHRDPRPDADPDLRPGRRAADGPARRVPAPHRARRAQARPRPLREGLHRDDDVSARWCASPSRSARSTACARSAARAASRTRRSSRCAARDGLLRDRRRRGRARDDADRGDRGGRLGGADARVPLEVPRQGLRPADGRDRRARQLALPRRPGGAPRRS